MQLSKKTGPAVGITIGLLSLLFAGCAKKPSTVFTEPATVITASAMESEETTQPLSVFVHICGAVVNEGVYELPHDARVVDAVEAAGGFDGEADKEAVNLAALLTDGMRIRIPFLSETTAEGASTDTRVNINTASEAELCTLSGIGPSRASDIIRYREQHGAFTCIEDIMKVSGIKNSVFEKIRDFITV